MLFASIKRKLLDHIFMSSTLTIILASIVVLFLLFLLFYSVWERVEVVPEEDLVLVKRPFREKRMELNKELVSWKLQQAHYLRWGIVYSINMLFKNGRRVGVSSRFNQDNFDSLYDHLSSRYKKRQEADQ